MSKYEIHASYSRLGEITVRVSRDARNITVKYSLGNSYLMSTAEPISREGETFTYHTQGRHQPTCADALDAGAHWVELLAGSVFEAVLLRAAVLDVFNHLCILRGHSSRILVSHIAPDLFSDEEVQLAHR